MGRKHARSNLALPCVWQHKRIRQGQLYSRTADEGGGMNTHHDILEAARKGERAFCACLQWHLYPLVIVGVNSSDPVRITDDVSPSVTRIS